MTERKPPDWEAIEREYRAGVVSVREIARRHPPLTEGAIRKRSKAEGWLRDLTNRVQAAVRSKAVRNAVRDANVRSDAEIIEEFAEVGAQVIEHHRSDIRTGRSIVANLMVELQTTNAQGDDLEKAIQAETAGDRNPVRRNAMLKAVSLPSRSATIRELSQAMRNLIGLERQAFNLDAADKPPASPLEGLSIDELGAVERALAGSKSEDAEGGPAPPQP